MGIGMFFIHFKMIKLIINNGAKFNNLTALKETTYWKKRRFVWVCDCWINKDIILYSVTSWRIKSCWMCKLHWMHDTRIYRIWQWIKERCKNKPHIRNKNYWAKGITYDKKWEKFEWFYEDMKEWYLKELSIDRINNDWNYNKANCRWATAKEQANNKTNNVMIWNLTMMQYCEKYQLNYKTFANKHRRLEILNYDD